MTTPLRLAHTPAPPSPATDSPPRDAIDAWLALLVSLLNLPDDERLALRDELESHLRDRVRDLVLSGAPDADASRQAISELGDAAAFARRYHQAIGPSKRRLVMNVVALSLAGAALLFSGIATLNSRGVTPAPCPPGQAATGQPGPATTLDAATLARLQVLLDANADPAAQRDHSLFALSGRTEPASVGPRALPQPSSLRFQPTLDAVAVRLADCTLDLQGRTAWRVVFASIEKSSGLPCIIDWEHLEKAGFTSDATIDVLPGSRASEVLAQSSEDHPDPVAARLQDGRLVFAPESRFDRQEQVLVVYDLSPLVARRAAQDPAAAARTIEETTKLISQIVFPDHWQSNGGDRAQVNCFDSKLFVQAPKRFHDKISWIMSQVLGQPAVPNADSTPAPADASR